MDIVSVIGSFNHVNHESEKIPFACENCMERVGQRIPK